MSSARLPALVVIAGSLAAGLLVQANRGEPVVTDDSGPGILVPAAPGEGSLSSTWYCAGGTGTEGGIADHVVLMANPGTEAVTATLTVLGGDVAPPLPDAASTTTTSTPPSSTTTPAAPRPVREPVVSQVEVPGGERVDVRLGTLLDAPLVSAVVEVDGGEVVVEHRLAGELGSSSAPCATTAATDWSFPWGTTARGNRELLVFMNPFPETATIDISFATDEGVRETRRFEGFPVPARSVVGAYVDEDVQRRLQLSAHVTTRAGRVVVDRIQTFDGTDGRRGLTVGLGAPTPALVWAFPDGIAGEGAGEQVVVFNPTAEVAEAQVEVLPADVDEAGIPEPFAVSVAPGRYALVSLHEDERVTPGTAHAVVVRSLNGVPVVAEQVRWSDGSDGSVRGVGATLGAPLMGRRWLLAAGSTSAEVDEVLTVVNLTDQDAEVDVGAFGDGRVGPIDGLRTLEVPSQGRVQVRLRDLVQRQPLPLVVESDVPVVVERSLYTSDAVGMSHSIAVPVGPTVVPDES
ncbi:MAG: DUF5719 family protein [Acidimicrobiia bacterium]